MYLAISINFTFDPIRPRLVMHTLARVLSIQHEVHKLETGQHIFWKHFLKCSQAFKNSSQKKFNNNSSTSRIEHKLRRTYKFFVISEYFDALQGKKVNARKNQK